MVLGVSAEVVPCPHRNQSLVNTHLSAVRKKSMSEFGRTLQGGRAIFSVSSAYYAYDV